jgi:hypothetical protein
LGRRDWRVLVGSCCTTLAVFDAAQYLRAGLVT